MIKRCVSALQRQIKYSTVLMFKVSQENLGSKSTILHVLYDLSIHHSINIAIAIKTIRGVTSAQYDWHTAVNEGKDYAARFHELLC